MHTVATLARKSIVPGLALAAVCLALLSSLVGPPTVLAADPSPCQPPAARPPLDGEFSGQSIPILNSPLLQATLIGLDGEYHAHIVWEPIAAPPPAISDGCKEDSKFTAEGFVGSLVASGPAIEQLLGLPSGSTATSPVPILSTSEPIDVLLQVHFGSESNKPILTFRSDTPINTVFGDDVRLIQIVGGEVLFSK